MIKSIKIFIKTFIILLTLVLSSNTSVLANTTPSKNPDKNIIIQQEHNDKLNSLNYKRKYKFKLDSDCNLNINFSHDKMPGVTENGWTIKLLDDSNKCCKEMFCSGNNEKINLDLGIKKGTYTIIISSKENRVEHFASKLFLDEKYADILQKKYTLSLKGIKGNYEKEPNNTIINCTNIESNTDYSGILNTGYDIDYYSFNVNADGYVNINFSHEKLEGVIDCGWDINLLNGSKETYKNIFSSGNDNLINEKIGLPKGKYYIEVKKHETFVSSDDSSCAIDKKYILNVNCIKDKYYEKEFNDTLQKSNSIEFGQIYTGNFSDSNDIDCYKFTVDTDTNISLKLNHKKFEGVADAGFKIAILDDTQKVYKEFTSIGNNPETLQNIDLNKGTYYIKTNYNNDLIWSANKNNSILKNSEYKLQISNK